VIEWLWLGTSLSTMQVVWAVVTLIGVTIALDPRHARNFKKELWLSGTLFGLLAALGQGGGAVISRYGYDVATGMNATILPMTAAFFRVSGGVIIALALLLLMRKTNTATDKPKRSRFTKPVIVLIVVNAFAGPILGVSCYQWALAVQPSFVVLPIVALAPIVIIPMSMIWEGDKPSPTSILGACVAVAGAIFLALATLS
jgi:drug/metabolite transporter (DMT)-like permease